MKFNLIEILFLLSLASFSLQTQAVQICGNYCGPNWCNGKVLAEKHCDTSMEPDQYYIKTDSCCQKHDHCCGFGNRSQCNDELIQCLVPPEAEYNNIICDSIFIEEFFEALDVLASFFGTGKMCCGTLCN